MIYPFKCPQCGEIYNLSYLEVSQNNLCRLCGAKLKVIEDYDDVVVEFDEQSEIVGESNVEGLEDGSSGKIIDVNSVDATQILDVEGELFDYEPYIDENAAGGDGSKVFHDSDIVSSVASVVASVRNESFPLKKNVSHKATEDIDTLDSINDKFKSDAFPKDGDKDKPFIDYPREEKCSVENTFKSFWEDSIVNKILVVLFAVFYILIMIYFVKITI